MVRRLAQSPTVQVECRRIDWNSIPWHGINKARQTGALATFLGIQFSLHEPLLHGIAIGDCNLFHFLESGFLYDWQPNLFSSDFGVNPAALSSISPNHEITFKHLERIGGSYHSGDTILLTTDAFASWLLSQLPRLSPHTQSQEQNQSLRSILERILELKESAGFSKMIDELRRKKEIRNDDTSLVVIHVDEAPEKPEQVDHQQGESAGSL